MEEGNGAEGETTATTLSDQLCQEPTLCYGDPPRLPDRGDVIDVDVQPGQSLLPTDHREGTGRSGAPIRAGR